MRDIRILLFNRAGKPVGEISSADGSLTSCVRTEEIKGEHSLSITTQKVLEEGTRAVMYGSDGKWHEYVLDEVEQSHDSGDCATGTYHFVWSLQYDLQTVVGEVEQPGMASKCGAMTALKAVLSGTSRWEIGSCDVGTTSQAIMAFDYAWDRLSTVVKLWGGEPDVTISVNGNGVTSRFLHLLDHTGSVSPTRRFEWGHDLTSISRTPEPGPYFCRVIPLGQGETQKADDDSSTFEWKLDISSSNGGRNYISDSDAEAAFRVSDGRGGWEYPTCMVEYATDDVDKLIQFATQDLYYHTRPQVSYEGSISQFESAGLNVKGLRLGDEVQVVDMGFNQGAPLKIQARVLRMVVDELGIDDVQLTIGRIKTSIERTLADMISAVGIESVSRESSDTSEGVIPVYQTPDLSHYTLTDETGLSFETPAYDSNLASSRGSGGVSGNLASIDNRVSALESGKTGTGGHGDIIHQLNGVTMTSGTISFTTIGNTSSNDFEDSEDSEETSGSTQDSSAKKPDEWGKSLNNDLAEASGVGFKFKKNTNESTWGSGTLMGDLPDAF